MSWPPVVAPSFRALSSSVLLAVAVAHATACGGGRPGGQRRDAAPPPVADGRLFTALPASYTGVDFENRLADTREFNVFTYRNFYNGGGVAIGDLTGDGRPELVLTANQGGARIYLNEGAFRFRDVTDAAGVRTPRDAWTTGVTLADVNGDGRLDVYLCRAGQGPPDTRGNELWINEGAGADGAPRFSEQAARWGVADQGYSTQSAFLDYDRDGDLDLFVINNSPKPANSFGLRNTRGVRDPWGGAKLFRNDGTRFTDVSAAAGIHSPEVAFGLGLAVADVNRDGWPDVYVSNDFFERDYLYVNRGDGTFDESLDRRTAVLSFYSMGLDVADVDNDGWPDVYTTDMLPEDTRRMKTVSSFDGWDTYQAKLRNGYGHQLMRNMLQRNNGDGTFAEVGQMAGVSRTDWSWSALLVDLDLDGRKDIYVTNGIYKDVTEQDYMAFLADQTTMDAVTNGGRERVDFLRLVRAMKTTPVANYAFRNQGTLRFANQAAAWGLAAPSVSSGAAYGDLDGDGAPDLVVSNVDQPAFVYRNNARALLPGHHWLQVRLEGTGANRFAVGARVTVRAGDAQLVQELAPTRGFQSSMDHTLGFGLGERAAVDSVTVEWPDGRTSVVRGVAADRRLVVRQAEAPGAPAVARPAAPVTPAAPPAGALLAAVGDSATLAWAHRENAFVDFDRDRLIPKLLSTEGPAVAVADVNGDGLDDLYLGGAKEQPGQLVLQRPDGRFAVSNAGLFEPDAIAEDVGATFFDANGDGRPDLYVVSGGNEFPDVTSALHDRLYLNDGNGRFRKAADALPADYVSGSRVVAADVDGDGDQDLFVGGRVVPWRYGMAPQSTLLVNDGRGRFTDATARLAPELARVGMVTDAVWRDVDGDRRPDLVVVGEWMPITVFRNAGGGRLERLAVPGLAQSHGWWNRVVAGDFTGDGRVDFVVGNLGLNGRLRASPATPATMVVKDFARNGYVQQIVACPELGGTYPLVMRDELLRSLPYLKARYLKYASFAGERVESMFTPAELAGATVDTAFTFATTLVRNDGGGRFTLVPLPDEAQLAPVYGVLAEDVDRDGATDLLLAGNFDGVQPVIGRMGASRGLVLRGDGKGGFTPLRPAESGFVVPGQARDIQRVRTRGGTLIVVARNDDRALLFRPTPRAPGGPGALASRAVHLARR